MRRPGPTAAASEEGTLWLDATGRPNANARDALRLLADAGLTGQRPRRTSCATRRRAEHGDLATASLRAFPVLSQRNAAARQRVAIRRRTAPLQLVHRAVICIKGCRTRTPRLGHRSTVFLEDSPARHVDSIHVKGSYRETKFFRWRQSFCLNAGPLQIAGGFAFVITGIASADQICVALPNGSSSTWRLANQRGTPSSDRMLRQVPIKPNVVAGAERFRCTEFL